MVASHDEVVASLALLIIIFMAVSLDEGERVMCVGGIFIVNSTKEFNSQAKKRQLDFGTCSLMMITAATSRPHHRLPTAFTTCIM